MTTPETSFTFTDPSGTSISMSYSKPLEESGRLKLSFSSRRILGGDAQPKGFHLSFNAIGDGDPLSFLESLDEGYLNDKVAGLSTSTPDLFVTIQAVRRVADDPIHELTIQDQQAVSAAVEAAAIAFDGPHRLACEGLINILARSEITCFVDDPGHLIGYRKTDENLVFHGEVWPEILRSLEDFLVSHPDVDARISEVREARPLDAGPEF